MTDGSITVLGAGNAGRALAGDLARLGADVVLWNRTPDHIVRAGLFDAPHLVGNPAAAGNVVTVVDGGCDVVEPTTGELLDEAARILNLDHLGARRGPSDLGS